MWPVNPIDDSAVADSSNIWIVSDKLELIHLKDGAVAKRLFAGEIVAVDFIDQDRGWSLMKNGDVLHTNDGGVNWQEIGKAESRWSFWTPGRMMEFANENVGWISAVQTLFRTEDGGRTWRAFDVVPGRDRAVDMIVINDNEFWCITVTGMVLHTLDGGAAWQTNELPGRKTGHRLGQSIALGQDGRVWAGVILPRPVLYVSSDRGATWDEGTIPADQQKTAVRSIQFAPDGIGRIVFQVITESDQPNPTSVAVTADAGSTWELLPTNGLHFKPRKVEFISQTVGFLIGASDIAMTEDGGKSWKVIYTSKDGTSH